MCLLLLLPPALTCVGHHQPAPGASEHRGRLLRVSAWSQRGLGGKEGFASSAERGPHRPVIRSQAPRKCLGVGRDMILCPFCNPWRAGGRTNNLISARDRDTSARCCPFFDSFCFFVQYTECVKLQQPQNIAVLGFL